MIKIVSGWSNPGGSTTAFILLNNLFNKHNIESCFYGPHKWHLDKTNSKQIESFNDVHSKPDDVLIFHFCRPPEYNVKKTILSCHEQDIFPIKKINYKTFDKIHYVSEHQKDYHSVKHPYFIIPNVLPELKISKNPKGVCGVIGSIDRNKQVHISIQKALDSGAKEVLIYGKVTDVVYYNEKVKPLIEAHKQVKLMDYCEDKQAIYDSVEKVFQDSKLETWGYVKAECLMTGTEFIGSEATDKMVIWNNEKILSEWVKEICLI